MKLSLALAILSFGFAASACSGSVDQPSREGTERGPIKQADSEKSSCVDRCGGKSAGACYCDEACLGYGDCCADYEASCVAPTCPDASDPSVHYISTSPHCPELMLSCEPGQTAFADACGCGCIGPVSPPPPPVCPDPEDPEVTYMNDSAGNPDKCAVILFTCEPGREPFSNECGCGCVGPVPPPAPPEPPLGCPDPNDPKVTYVNDSAGDPYQCMAILFTCEPGQTLFSNECGCGCIAP
jgi:hypothetical protein